MYKHVKACVHREQVWQAGQAGRGRAGMGCRSCRAGGASRTGRAGRTDSTLLNNKLCGNIEKDKKMHTAASTQELPENQQKCPGAPESENASKC